MGDGLEIEIKLAVADRDEMARRLDEAGAEVVSSRTFEDNWLFDFADARLKERRVMVRLRDDGNETRLTLKEPTDEEGDYKVRREVETVVENGEAVRDVLTALGLQPVYRYQKYRAVYRCGDLVVTLDELPIGVYVELEGSRADIDACADRLGFTRSDYINVSYRELQIRQRQDRGDDEEPTAMIFTDGADR